MNIWVSTWHFEIWLFLSRREASTCSALTIAAPAIHFGELGEVAISDWVEDIALAVREGPRDIWKQRGAAPGSARLERCWPASV
jgi:hypothetical protein